MFDIFDSIEKKVEELKRVVEDNGYEYDFYSIDEESLFGEIGAPIIIKIITKDKKIFVYKGGYEMAAQDGSETVKWERKKRH